MEVQNSAETRELFLMGLSLACFLLQTQGFPDCICHGFMSDYLFLNSNRSLFLRKLFLLIEHFTGMSPGRMSALKSSNFDVRMGG